MYKKTTRFTYVDNVPENVWLFYTKTLFNPPARIHKITTFSECMHVWILICSSIQSNIPHTQTHITYTHSYAAVSVTTHAYMLEHNARRWTYTPTINRIFRIWITTERKKKNRIKHQRHSINNTPAKQQQTHFGMHTNFGGMNKKKQQRGNSKQDHQLRRINKRL